MIPRSTCSLHYSSALRNTRADPDCLSVLFVALTVKGKPLRWIEFNGRARDVLLNRDAIVTEVVPSETIDLLLSDALAGRKLRHSVLNFLWGVLFTEMWIREHAS